MERIVQAEILDQLPPCNMDAIASRRDLRTINGLMGNFRWIHSALSADRADTKHRYLELGAGDGILAKRLIRSLPPGSYSALDRAPKPEDWPEAAHWLRRDCLDYSDYDNFTHLIANLFLHHLQAEELAALGQRIKASSIRKIIACEPCRRPIHKWQVRAGRWIGFNRVTLSDGCTSVDAGFRGDELPQSLQLSPDEWEWTIRETSMGAYRMWAERR
jgi:hypothetical protein